MSGLGPICRHSDLIAVGCGSVIGTLFLFLFFKFIYLFIYFWLCWFFVSVPGLSLVAASGGHSSLRCADLSLLRPLLLRSTGSRRAGSVIVAHGPSCSVACGIFPDQGSNPCLLYWQADSQPLRHQGSPQYGFFFYVFGHEVCGILAPQPGIEPAHLTLESKFLTTLLLGKSP